MPIGFGYLRGLCVIVLSAKGQHDDTKITKKHEAPLAEATQGRVRRYRQKNLRAAAAKAITIQPVVKCLIGM
jgi:hypothetical protein